MDLNDRVIPVIDWNQTVPYVSLVGDIDATPIDRLFSTLPRDITDAVRERLELINSRRVFVKANVPERLLHLRHVSSLDTDVDATELVTKDLLATLDQASTARGQEIASRLLDACGMPRPDADADLVKRLTRQISIIPMYSGVRPSTSDRRSERTSAFSVPIINFRIVDITPPMTEARDDT